MTKYYLKIEYNTPFGDFERTRQINKNNYKELISEIKEQFKEVKK